MTFVESLTAHAKYTIVIKSCTNLSPCFITQFWWNYVHVLQSVFYMKRALCPSDELPKCFVYKQYQTRHCHGCDCEDRELMIWDAVSFAANTPTFLTNLLSPSSDQRSQLSCNSLCFFAATFFFRVVQRAVPESPWHRGTKRFSESELCRLLSY